MSLLMVHEDIDFNALKDRLQVTDGNLASHISTLEKHDYVTVEKTFVGKKPNTTYRATPTGRQAFKDHLDALEQILKGNM